jgi:hypothetical protein
MKKNIFTGILSLLFAGGLFSQTNSFPNGVFSSKGTSTGGSAIFSGSVHSSYFHYADNEDNYIRGGKTTSNIFIGDYGAAGIYLGGVAAPTYIQGFLQANNGMLTQNGIQATKGTNFAGSAVFSGSTYSTHFHYSTNEDIYIRGGKNTSSLIIGDYGAAVVSLGNAAAVSYSQGLFQANNGLYAFKGTNAAGSAVFTGSAHASHFNYSTTEDTYIRGGLSASNLYLADVNNAVIVGVIPSLPAGYKMYVEKGILTEKVKVAIKTTANWSDYVFGKNYKLMPLPQVEKYIQQYKHLPGIPSAAEVVKDGIDLADINAKLLAKVEELTLHMIAMEKEVAQLKKASRPVKNNIINHTNNRR